MQIINKQTADLIPYVNNARTHSQDQVIQIASSIKEFGFTNPVLIDSQNGIIAGHGRVMAATKLNMDSVPCIILDGLTDIQKKAYILADNKIALNAGWDEELLNIELQELKNFDFDLTIIGFDDYEFKIEGCIEEEDNNNPYSSKVETPTYAPTKDKAPEITELYDTEKTKHLIDKINSCEISKDLKTFLIYAAHRHTVFNYANIAEFYAHASAEVQEVFEDSALVIIDFEKAIENGYIKITQEIDNLIASSGCSED